MVSVRKISPTLNATQIPVELTVLTSTGTAVKGKAGDYLMTGAGDPFFVSAAVYASDYEVVPDATPAKVAEVPTVTQENTVTQAPLQQ
ncbi:MAG: hypothetical protein LUQ71_10160 [Methanoregula sp.]|nr:hypothetical protein [Methanoregula sp.]